MILIKNARGRRVIRGNCEELGDESSSQENYLLLKLWTFCLPSFKGTHAFPMSQSKIILWRIPVEAGTARTHPSFFTRHVLRVNCRSFNKNLHLYNSLNLAGENNFAISRENFYFGLQVILLWVTLCSLIYCYIIIIVNACMNVYNIHYLHYFIWSW